MKNKTTAIVLSSVVAVAGLTAVGGATMAAASGSSHAVTAQQAADDSTNPPAPPTLGTGDRTDGIRSALDGLVKDGTITATQADAVATTLASSMPGPGGPGGPGGHGPMGGPGLDAAAKALGMTADELRTQLESGKSLADVAKAKGIDKAKVVDALVADLKAHLAEEVTSGEHTQAEADAILAGAKERITAMVDAQGPMGGPMMGGDRGPGMGGHDMDADGPDGMGQGGVTLPNASGGSANGQQS